MHLTIIIINIGVSNFQTPFVNQSAPKVDSRYSLLRMHAMFRSQGLRHLTVIDQMNCVVGMITRKDLMTFHIEERLIQKATEEVVTDMELVSIGNDYSRLIVMHSCKLRLS